LGGRRWNIHNTKICCGFYQTGFLSSDKWQCFGFPLQDMGVTSPIIVEGSQVLSYKGIPNFQVTGATNEYTLLVMKV
jgi:hypothetical protein